MQYLIIPDNKNPNYLKPNGTRVKVETFSDAVVIGSPYEVIKDLTGYTPFAIAGPFTHKEQQDALKALDEEYQVKINKGVIINDITMAATENDQNAFTRLTTLLGSIEATMTEEQRTGFFQTRQSIADIYGVSHYPTVLELHSIIIQYGLAVAQLWGEMALKRSAILAATITD